MPNSIWGIWKIEENPGELFLQLEHWEEYIPTLNKFQSERRKAEWLAVRVLLKALTGRELIISYRENGAPFLVDDPLNISISHTKGYAAVMLSSQQPVGIDIEYHSERIHRIKSRFLSEADYEETGTFLDTDDLLVFWSAKETAYKMIGLQAVDFQSDLQIIDCDLIRSQGIVGIMENATPENAIFNINFWITPDFVLTYCDKTF